MNEVKRLDSDDNLLELNKSQAVYIAELERQVTAISEREDYQIEQAAYWTGSAERWRQSCGRMWESIEWWTKRSRGMQAKRDEAVSKHDSLKAETDKRIAILKAELIAANEALLDQAGSNDLMIIEMAMVYNRELVLGEVEISAEEMSVYAADKITVPVTAKA